MVIIQKQITSVQGIILIEGPPMIIIQSEGIILINKALEC